MRSGEFVAFRVTVGDFLTLRTHGLVGFWGTRMGVSGDNFNNLSPLDPLLESRFVKLAAQFFRRYAYNLKGSIAHAR